MSGDRYVEAALLGIPAAGLLVVCVRAGVPVSGLDGLVRSGVGLVVVVAVLVAVRVVAGRCGRSVGVAGRAVVVRGHAHGSPTAARRQIARHEAGHAAAARALGGRVVSAQVDDHGEGGLVRACIPAGPEAAVTFLLAGQVAAGTTRGAGADDDQIRRELRGLSGPERARVRRDAGREARRIVARRHTEIRRDTATLHARGRL